MQMGSNKNKLHNRNNDRHVYRKKKLPCKYKKTSPTLNKHSEMNGSRIINLNKLQQYTDDLTAHATHCEGSIMLYGETRQGLASILKGHCSVCTHTFTLQSSHKVKGPKGYSQWECNLAAVWGEMVTGGGHCRIKETLGVMGVPVMTKASFINIERGIGEQWKSKLQEAMAVAGKEEKRLAEERGVIHEGVPAITVVLDGGWSMRSQVWPSSLARRQESCCTLVYVTNTAVHVLRTCPKRVISGSRIGKNPHLKWSQT